MHYILGLFYAYRFPQVQFDYQSPGARFDRSKVKGPVIKLVRVKDATTATALEITAGGKVCIAINSIQINISY